MDPKESLLSEIRAMALECAACEQDARDAELAMGADLALECVAHPEPDFSRDRDRHRIERHQDKIIQKLKVWSALRQSGCC
jgi:hypothetical protein